MAQNQTCIPLAGSTACPAFNQSSISTGPELVGYFPFLSFVSDVASFDDRLRNYIATSFTQQRRVFYADSQLNANGNRYQHLIGCDNVNLANTTDYYARYTTSVICNAIVQISGVPCQLPVEQMRPLCAETCAEYALSEHAIAASPELCGDPGPNAISQIRADFTHCALPANSLSGICISGVDNEPEDCGYQSNLSGLCNFCAKSSPNSTDSCCVNAQVESRCDGVDLPTTTSFTPVFPQSTSMSPPPTSATATPTAAPDPSDRGLSGGAIAGIVIGSLLGAAALLGLIILACILARRRRNGSQTNSVFNQPSPSRHGPPPAHPPPQMATYDGARHAAPEILPGGRVARMAALEDTSSTDPTNGYSGGSSDEYNTSPEGRYGLPLGAGGLPKRNGSLSSHSALGLAAAPSPGTGTEDTSSPYSAGNGGEYASSPEGPGSGQSEQLLFFKDYYSTDEIRPGDTVATLWAYQPRANDEFELERGDLLKVVGIWDDGWATGVKLAERAEEWEVRRQGQRDSGMSSGSGGGGGALGGEGGAGGGGLGRVGEIKAFPLVCVCVPRHWRKTIEGDPATEMGTTGGGQFGASP